MQQQMPFPLSENNRIYAPSFVSNLLLLSAFYGGVAALALFFIPHVMHENLPRDAYLYSGVGLLGIWLFTILILWFGDLWNGWQKRRAIRKVLEEKNLLAAWQYPALEWQALAEIQSNAEARSGYKLWHTLITLLLVGAILAYMAYAMPPEARIVILPIGIFLVVIILFSAIISRITQQIVLVQNRTRRAENPTPTLYVSRKGLYHETEGLLQFNRIQNVSVDLADNFPRLSFTIWISFGRGGRWPVSMSVPIPQQHVADAQQIAVQLNRKG